MNQSRLCISPQCVLATYASILGVVLFFKLKPKKKAAITEKWSCESTSASSNKVLKSTSNVTLCQLCCIFQVSVFQLGLEEATRCACYKRWPFVVCVLINTFVRTLKKTCFIYSVQYYWLWYRHISHKVNRVVLVAKKGPYSRMALLRKGTRGGG